MNGHEKGGRTRGSKAIFQAVTEALEQRRLLASVALVDGVLYVFGANGVDDNINISLNENAERIIVTAGTMERRFFYADVGGIQVSTRSGSDSVEISLAITRNATVFGEGGDDHLFMGGGNDKVFGGDGSDRIIGGTGGDTLRGENGGDVISGGGGRDLIFLHDGGGKAFGDAGDDTL